MKKIEWIDAIRGYAVLGVVIVHSVAGYTGIFAQNFLGLGAKGVQLFYMASAFTLTLSHYNRFDEIKSNTKFYIRRFFRIAPMFWLAIVYYLWQNNGEIYEISDYRYITNWGIISHFIFLHGLSPYWQDSIVPGGWSVGVEYLFYFICPLIFYYVKSKTRAIWLYFFSLALSLSLSLILLEHPLIPFNITWKGYLYGFFLGQFHIFGLGILVYFLTQEKISSAFCTLIIIFIGGGEYYWFSSYFGVSFRARNKFYY